MIARALVAGSKAVRGRSEDGVRDVIVMASLVVTGVLLCLIRVPGEHHDVVWAEDANVFLYENVNQGFWGTIFTGYAGYQHLVPRLGAGLVLAAFPLENYASAVFVLCSVITGLVGAAVYWLSRGVVQWVPACVALALITVVLPLATQEVIGNLADLHTYFMWLAPWLFVYRPQSWASGAAWAVVAFLAVMTEVQAIIFLPLALMLVTRRNRYSWPLIFSFAVGSLWQLVTAATVDRNSDTTWLGVPSIVQGWLINTVLPLLIVHPDAVRRELEAHGLLVPMLLLMPFAISFVLVMIWGTGCQRLLAVTLALASAAIYAGGAVVDGGAYFRYAEQGAEIWQRIVNVRYGVSSGMMLAALVPLAAAIVRRRGSAGSMGRWFAAVAAWSSVLGLIAVLALASTRAVSTRGWVDGPWSPAVVAAREACNSRPSEARTRLPVAPGRAVAVTCAQLSP